MKLREGGTYYNRLGEQITVTAVCGVRRGFYRKHVWRDVNGCDTFISECWYGHEPGGPKDLVAEVLPGLQPIETAPKDGTYILLLGPPLAAGLPIRCEVGRWSSSDQWMSHKHVAFEQATHWLPMPVLEAPNGNDHHS